jgi:hypothetical protein
LQLAPVTGSQNPPRYGSATVDTARTEVIFEARIDALDGGALAKVRSGGERKPFSVFWQHR